MVILTVKIRTLTSMQLTLVLILLFCRSSRKSLKVLGTVGEPINPEAWLWYYHTVGDAQCSIVDTYWQTETVSKQCWQGGVSLSKCWLLLLCTDILIQSKS